MRKNHMGGAQVQFLKKIVKWATVTSWSESVKMTKPNLAAGYHNTHGCCCCALLRRADYSPVSRQPHHRHPASEHRDHGRTAGTCGSTPRLQTSIKKQDPVRRKTAAMVRLLEQNLYCITSFINSHLCKVSAYNKMYACTPANISLRAYHDN